jgi:hypothetical protein
MSDCNETYIGDGVYASFDGYQIWLRVNRDGMRDETIALEPNVFAELYHYAARVFSPGGEEK